MAFDLDQIVQDERWEGLRSNPRKMEQARERLFESYRDADPWRSAAYESLPEEERQQLRSDFMHRLDDRYGERVQSIPQPTMRERATDAARAAGTAVRDAGRSYLDFVGQAGTEAPAAVPADVPTRPQPDSGEFRQAQWEREAARALADGVDVPERPKAQPDAEPDQRDQRPTPPPGVDLSQAGLVTPEMMQTPEQRAYTYTDRVQWGDLPDEVKELERYSRPASEWTADERARFVKDKGQWLKDDTFSKAVIGGLANSLVGQLANSVDHVLGGGDDMSFLQWAREARLTGADAAETATGRFLTETLPSLVVDSPVYVAAGAKMPIWALLPALDVASQAMDMHTQDADYDPMSTATSAILGAALRFMPRVPGRSGGPVRRVGQEMGDVAMRGAAATTATTGFEALRQLATDGEIQLKPEHVAESYLTTVAMYTIFRVPQLVKAGRAGQAESRLRGFGLKPEHARELVNIANYEGGTPAGVRSVLDTILKDKAYSKSFSEFIIRNAYSKAPVGGDPQTVRAARDVQADRATMEDLLNKTAARLVRNAKALESAPVPDRAALPAASGQAPMMRTLTPPAPTGPTRGRTLVTPPPGGVPTVGTEAAGGVQGLEEGMTPAGAQGRREEVRPELMTPEEWIVEHRRQLEPGNIPLRQAGFKGAQPSSRPHRSLIVNKVALSEPVSAAAVDAYGVTLPEGYVREGDRYVFKADPGVEVRDVTPKGFGPDDAQAEPMRVERMSGETVDQAMARYVQDQVDNGLVSLEQGRDGWVARVSGVEEGAVVTRTAFKKQALVNEVFKLLYPDAEFSAAAGPEVIPGTRSVAERSVDVENRFIDAVQEQFGYDRAQANQILERFKKDKLVKLDKVAGGFQLTDGRLWDREVMDQIVEPAAAAPAAGPKGPAAVSVEQVDAAQGFERDDLFVAKGRQHFPGLRAQDHETAGRLAYVVEKGEATLQDWEEYVSRVRSENRVSDESAPVVPPKAAEPAAVAKPSDTIRVRLGDREWTEMVQQVRPDGTALIDVFGPKWIQPGDYTVVQQYAPEPAPDPKGPAAVAEPTLEGQTVTSPKGEAQAAKTADGALKPPAQKRYLLEQIDEAIKLAPADQVTGSDALDAIDLQMSKIEGELASWTTEHLDLARAHLQLERVRANMEADPGRAEMLAQQVADLERNVARTEERLGNPHNVAEYRQNWADLKRLKQERRALYGTVTIHVPGDGTFTILNTREALEEFKKMAGKFPVSPTKSTSAVQRVSTAPKQIVKVPKSRSKARADLEKALKPILSTDETRKILHQVHVDGDSKTMVATDGRRLGVILGTPFPTTKHEVRDDEGKLQEATFPNFAQVVPGYRKGQMPERMDHQLRVDSFELAHDLNQAFAVVQPLKVSGETEGELLPTVSLFRMPDGTVGVGAGDDEVGGYESTGRVPVKSGEFIGNYNMRFLQDGLGFLRRMGNSQVEIDYVDEMAPLLLRGKNEYYVLMPMRSDGGNLSRGVRDVPERDPDAGPAADEPAPGADLPDMGRAGYMDVPSPSALEKSVQSFRRVMRRMFSRYHGMSQELWETVRRHETRLQAAGMNNKALQKEFQTGLRELQRAGHERQKLMDDFRDVVYGRTELDGFRQHYGLAEDHVAVKALRNFTESREVARRALVESGREFGLPETLLQAFRDNEYYVARAYLRFMAPEEFQPDPRDYRIAVQQVQAELAEGLERFLVHATKVRGKRVQFDVIEWLETGDRNLLRPLSSTRRKAAEALRRDYRAMVDMIDGLYMDGDRGPRPSEDARVVSANINAARLADAAEAYTDYYLKRDASVPGTGIVETGRYRHRFLEGAFRKLYGEVTDPKLAAAITQEAQAKVLSQLTLFNELAEVGKGRWWSGTPSESLGLTHRLGRETDRTDRLRYGPLAGQFVSKELHDFLSPAKQSGKFSLARTFGDFWLLELARHRIFAVLHGRPAMRNYLNNYQYPLMSGDIFLPGYGENLQKSHTLLYRYLRGDANAIRQMAELSREDVFHETISPIAEDIAASLRGPGGSRPTRAIKKVLAKSATYYSYIDFPTRVAAYWTAIQNGMSPEQAVNHVREHYQYRPAVPTGIRGLSRLPFADFLGYKVNSMQIWEAGLRGAVEGSREGDWRKPIGFAMASSWAGMHAAVKWGTLGSAFVAAWAAIHQMLRSLRGDDDDVTNVQPLEDDLSALRVLVPHYDHQMPIALWQERHDGSRVLYYSVWNNLSVFPHDDILAAAVHRTHEDGVLAGLQAAKDVAIQQYVQPGMMPQNLYQSITGNELSFTRAGRQSRGLTDLHGVDDPDRNDIIVRALLNYATGSTGQYGQSLRNILEITSRREAGQEPLVGSYTRQSTYSEAASRLVRLIRTYKLDFDSASIMMRDRLGPLATRLNLVHQRLNDPQRQELRYGVADPDSIERTDALQKHRTRLINESTRIVEAMKDLDEYDDARRSGHWFDEGQLHAILLDSGFGRREATIIMRGLDDPGYQEPRQRPTRLQRRTPEAQEQWRQLQ